jgi:hypothetical protein
MDQCAKLLALSKIGMTRVIFLLFVKTIVLRVIYYVRGGWGACHDQSIDERPALVLTPSI